ncbi:MAG: FAD-dependent oxidoreductase [Rhodobacteraceae bacterium]|nr:FAD-dependent oxidoreductase [Paracoccaceae bacterium]
MFDKSGKTKLLTRRALMLGATATSLILTNTASSLATPSRIKRLPDPVGFRITRWAHDPHSYGSYSYLAVGSAPKDRRKLAGPIGQTLFFAGEATHSDYPATVHGALLSGQLAARQVAQTSRHNVAVIGAGVAGLAAAQSLVGSGHSVTVFESHNRIGGRVITDRTLGVALDMGASWIHGVNDNPLTYISDQLGLKRVATRDSFVARDHTGALLKDRDMTIDFERILEVEHEFAADFGNLARRAKSEGKTYSGSDVIFPDGFDQILGGLRSKAQILKNTPVTLIEHQLDSATITSGNIRRSFDAVIVTVPLGVLKSGNLRFSPELPAGKAKAIDRLGMGVLDKVYLKFPKPFWDQTQWIGYSNPQRARFAQWLNIHHSTGSPILLAFNAGSAARSIARQSDNQIVEEAISALTAMYG